MQNADALTEIMAGVAVAAASLPVDEADRRLCEEDVPSGIVRSLEELPDDPQIVANETFVLSEHPLAGTLRETRPSPRFGGTPARVGGPAPVLGEHTDEILRELGMGDRIPELRANGTVA